MLYRTGSKEPLARQLGATHYIDSQATDPATELAKLGGARVVLATVTDGPTMSATVGGLAPHGRLMVLGAAGPMAAEAYDRMTSGKARFRVIGLKFDPELLRALWERSDLSFPQKMAQ